MKALLLLALLQTVLALPTDDSLLSRIPSSHVPKWELMVDHEGNTFLIDANPLTDDVKAGSLFEAWTDVEFLLYTRKNPEHPMRLKLNVPESIKNSNFDASKPCRYIIHGWNSNRKSGVNVLNTKAYLEKGDYNVIVVDWEKGANHLVYSTSRGRIESVADVTAAFIDYLATDFGAKVSEAVIVGHSLGGHTAGLVGKKLKQGRLQRIVALDPAGPSFDLNKHHERLHIEDAEQVEVIHTCAGTLGFTEDIGDIDFYPNYGKGQPGCWPDPAGTCAHSRSYELFSESIVSDTLFQATKCESYNEVMKDKCTSDGTTGRMGGEPLEKKPKGVYFVETNKKSPFALG